MKKPTATPTPKPLLMFAALRDCRVLGCGDSPDMARAAAHDRLRAMGNPAPEDEEIDVFPITHDQVARIERGQRDALELQILSGRGARGGFSVGVYDQKFLRDYLEESGASPFGYIGHRGRQPRIDVQVEGVLRAMELSDREIAWFLCSRPGRHLGDHMTAFAGSPGQMRDRIAKFLDGYNMDARTIKKCAAEEAA